MILRVFNENVTNFAINEIKLLKLEGYY